MLCADRGKEGAEFIAAAWHSRDLSLLNHECRLLCSDVGSKP